MAVSMVWLTSMNVGPKFHSHLVKFGYSEKATKFEKIFHEKFDITE